MSILKKHITGILIWFVGLAVISLLVLGFVLDFEDTRSTTTICKEIGHGNYQNLDKLLKPDSSLKKIKFNNDGKPLYTEQQKSEIHELYVECGVRRLPLVDSWFITAEELKNIYKKFLKLVTN
ncbi:hypothetical protein Megpolyxen_01089 [Candidatus Megaera polyxenophila]|nr:hypothetical protein Megpolyxen_01089 [Candidatus Megaera polyxenophila]